MIVSWSVVFSTSALYIYFPLVLPTTEGKRRRALLTFAAKNSSIRSFRPQGPLSSALEKGTWLPLVTWHSLAFKPPARVSILRKFCRGHNGKLSRRERKKIVTANMALAFLSCIQTALLSAGFGNLSVKVNRCFV